MRGPRDKTRGFCFQPGVVRLLDLNLGVPMRRLNVLSDKDIMQLLQNEVKRAGGQSAWARKNKVDRAHLNRILSGHKTISPTILKKLGIRTVYVLDEN